MDETRTDGPDPQAVAPGPNVGFLWSNGTDIWITNNQGEDVTVQIPLSGSTQSHYTFVIDMKNEYGLTLRFDDPDIIRGKHPVVITPGKKRAPVEIKVGTPPGRYSYDAVTTNGDQVMGTDELSQSQDVARRRPRIIVESVGTIEP